jgi:hypothetical protein
MLRSLRSRPRWYTSNIIPSSQSSGCKSARRDLAKPCTMLDSTSNLDAYRSCFQQHASPRRGLVTSSVPLAQSETAVSQMPQSPEGNTQVTKEQIENVDLTGWETIIGLEIHAQLKTSRKLFSCMHLLYRHSWHDWLNQVVPVTFCSCRDELGGRTEYIHRTI